jgi:hypothetical protein
MNLENLRIWVSPITNKIYAGYINKDGVTARQKVDVTEQVLSAVAEHIDQEQCVYEFAAGTLKFERKE